MLERLHGIAVDGPDLEILLRHPAVMFGLLGPLLVATAFRPEWRALAIYVGLASAVAFLATALAVGGHRAAIRRVVVADIVAIACLVLARWQLRRAPA